MRPAGLQNYFNISSSVSIRYNIAEKASNTLWAFPKGLCVSTAYMYSSLTPTTTRRPHQRPEVQLLLLVAKIIAWLRPN
jgi:hypothetical protein